MAKGLFRRPFGRAEKAHFYPCKLDRVVVSAFVQRMAIKQQLDKLLNGFEIRLGGTTSIDITKAGIDKSYAISKITEIFGYSKQEMDP